MSKYKVVVINPGYESYRFEREILEPAGAELIIAGEDCITEELIISTACDADAILVREGPINRSVIESFEHCKIIARYGVGIDNVDLEAARQKKIYVSIFPIIPFPFIKNIVLRKRHIVVYYIQVKIDLFW